MNKLKWFFVVCSVAIVACSKKANVHSEALPVAQPAVQASAVSSTEPQPFDLFYGVYVQGHKVGTMHSSLSFQNNTAVFSTNLDARMAGMGQVSHIRVLESRTYNTQNNELQSIVFSQEAATGTVRVEGQRNAQNQLALTVTAGGSAQQQMLPIQETLQNAFILDKLAQRATLHDRMQVVHFDPSMQKNVTIQYTVEAIEQRLLGGVPTQTLKVVAHYEELGVDEETWIDQTGKILESHMGGFFVARLEPEEQAKQLDYQHDILISATVKPPEPIEHASQLTSLQLEFTGFQQLKPPTSERQKVTQHENMTSLTLTKDPNIPSTILLTETVALAQKNTSLQPYRMPTAFIQSAEPELVETAKKIIASTKTTAEAVEALSHFVYEHVQDEYVPTYSNALEALKTKRGDCTEHSILFVGLARAIGLPARVAVGVAYWPPGNGFGWHAWSEVWINNRWYTVDPTWNQTIADATHIKLAEGDPSQQARIVMLMGQLHIQSVHVTP